MYSTCPFCNGSGETSCWDGSSTCGDCPPECPYDGDANGDGELNVLDVVIIVGNILDGRTFCLLFSGLA